MQISKLVKDLNIVKTTGDVERNSTEVLDVVYDSRKVKPGSLFVAIKGLQNDGHQFIKDAVRAGSPCIVCDYPPQMDLPKTSVWFK